MGNVYVVCKTKEMSDEPVKAFKDKDSAIKWVRKMSKSCIKFTDEELNNLSGYTITEVGMIEDITIKLTKTPNMTF